MTTTPKVSSQARPNIARHTVVVGYHTNKFGFTLRLLMPTITTGKTQEKTYAYGSNLDFTLGPLADRYVIDQFLD